MFDTKKLLELAVEACEEDSGYLGYCLACGEECDGVEPDAEHYKCESCGANQLAGAEQIVLMFA